MTLSDALRGRPDAIRTVAPEGVSVGKSGYNTTATSGCDQARPKRRCAQPR
jgi:hypothetical protein